MTDGRFELNGLATMIGSMPQSDPQEACSAVLAHLPDIPAWPQLPQRSFFENMYVQYSEGLPGVVLTDDSIWVDRSQDLSQPLEELYSAYIENDTNSRAVSPEYAAGFHEFLRAVGGHRVKALKGQVTGPISFGLTVTDQDRRPLLYDDTLADAIAKHLRLKAAWQEEMLRKHCSRTVMSVDEPYLASVGSAFVSTSPEQVTALLEEVLGGISGLKAIHCCGNTDWSLLLGTSTDILSFDAYSYGDSLALYPSDVQAFLERGGVIAWGIVPNQPGPVSQETAESILERLEGLIAAMSDKGVSKELLLGRCLITPACALASLSPEEADRALEMTAKVSSEFRRRHFGIS